VTTKQAEPRLGVAYNIKPTNTVLRISYARILETPFNENLVLASEGCNDPVINALMSSLQGYPCLTVPVTPGFRNEFHAGFQQAFANTWSSMGSTCGSTRTMPMTSAFWAIRRSPSD